MWSWSRQCTPAMSVSDAECSAVFKSAGKNNNGMLSKAESAQYFAAMRVASKRVVNSAIPQEDFTPHCKAEVYMIAKTDAARPFDYRRRAEERRQGRLARHFLPEQQGSQHHRRLQGHVVAN